MTVRAAVLYTGGQLTNTASILFMAGYNTAGTVITTASFTNTDTVAHSITVYIVRNGGSPGAANVIIDNRQLAPDETYTSLELQNQILNLGDTLQALADTSGKVTCAGISGYIITV